MALTTSPSLLLRICSQTDRDAWSQFLEIYAPMVRSYCFQRGLQEADTLDIVQEVMSRVSRSISDFEYDSTKGRFRGWLGTIVANQIKSFLSKGRRQPEERQTASAIDMIYSDPDTDWIAIFSERIFSIACQRVRTHFSEVTWQSFEATWICKEPAGEVARMLGIATRAVYVNKSRVLKRLEEEVRILAEDVPIP